MILLDVKSKRIFLISRTRSYRWLTGPVPPQPESCRGSACNINNFSFLQILLCLTKQILPPCKRFITAQKHNQEQCRYQSGPAVPWTEQIINPVSSQSSQNPCLVEKERPALGKRSKHFESIFSWMHGPAFLMPCWTTRKNQRIYGGKGWDTPCETEPRGALGLLEFPDKEAAIYGKTWSLKIYLGKFDAVPSDGSEITCWGPDRTPSGLLEKLSWIPPLILFCSRCP